MTSYFWFGALTLSSSHLSAFGEEGLFEGVGMKVAAHAGLGGFAEGVEGGGAGLFQVVDAASAKEIARVQADFDFGLRADFQNPFEAVHLGGDEVAGGMVEFAEGELAFFLGTGEGGFELEEALDGEVATFEGVFQVRGPKCLTVGRGVGEDVMGKGHDEIAAFSKATILHDGEDFEVAIGVKDAVEGAREKKNDLVGDEFDGLHAVHGEEFDLPPACKNEVDFGTNEVDVGAAGDDAVGTWGVVDLDVGEADTCGKDELADIHMGPGSGVYSAATDAARAAAGR